MTCKEDIATRITARHGLTRQSRWNDLIADAVHDLGERLAIDVSGVAESLPRDPRLLDEIAGRLTVPETFFLRHQPQFAYVTEYVLEKLRSGGAPPPVRMLSAGCASGEEPYSLALCLWRALSAYPADRLELYACDLSAVAIERAKAARYSAWSFRGTPGWLLQDHFDAQPDGRLQLKSQIRDCVRFEVASITDALRLRPSAFLDVVLFRNVGIYLSEEYLQQVYSEFARVLKGGGLLVVAPSDPRPPKQAFVRLAHESTSIYGRRDEDEVVSVQHRAANKMPRRRKIDGSPCAGSRPRPSSDGDTSVRAAAMADDVVTAPRVRALADAGQITEALRLADRLVVLQPTDATVHMLRGELLLAGTRGDDRRGALEALRRAVFLAPDNPLARYWYAHALVMDGQVKRSLGQLQALAQLLEGSAAESLIEGGPVTAAELLQAQSLLREMVA